MCYPCQVAQESASLHELSASANREIAVVSLMQDLLFQGKVHEAAAMYARAGAQDQAIAMYRDMRMFRYDRVGMLYLTALCEAYMLASFKSASLVHAHMQ